jgi:DNA-binding IclR family transcriptional regulator
MSKARDRKPTPPIEKAEREPQELHRIPVIDKMMQIIEEIRVAGTALSITTITEKTRIPRSTVYRVLNTLSSHGIITRNANGDYSLGFGLVALAASVDTDVSRDELIRLSHPVLSQLANDLGETCKLSVLEGMAVEVIDVVQSTNPMAPSSRIGSQFPLHAGAASKLLLAYAPDKLVQTVVREKLEQFTDNTIVDKAALLDELAAIRAAGISHDAGEWNANVHALSAPVFRAGGTAIAALSVTYFASQSDAEEEARLQGALTRAAAAVSKLLGHSG